MSRDTNLLGMGAGILLLINTQIRNNLQRLEDPTLTEEQRSVLHSLNALLTLVMVIVGLSEGAILSRIYSQARHAQLFPPRRRDDDNDRLNPNNDHLITGERTAGSGL